MKHIVIALAIMTVYLAGYVAGSMYYSNADCKYYNKYLLTIGSSKSTLEK